MSMSESKRFETPRLMVEVNLKTKGWKGDPRQAKEKIRQATARAFQNSRLEMMAWMQEKVPQDTRTLLMSGIQTLSREAHVLNFPFKMYYGFPARVPKGKGMVSYAAFVDQMRTRGAQPRQPGTIAPYIDRGKQFLINRVYKNLESELGEEFGSVSITLNR